MPTMPFKYDAFISYSSADRPWAKQLADDLAARNFKIFLDRTNLDVGDPWDEQLDDSLDVAQHLIVLWSRNSSASKYVDYERTYFHLKTRDSRTDSAAAARKEILILLEDPPPTVRNTLQMIPELREAGSYANPIDQRDLNVWGTVLRRVEQTLRDRSNSLRILVAVLATSRAFLESFDFERVYPLFCSMSQVITQMGFNSKDDLLDHYGATFNDWRPFGDEANIWTVLDNLKTRVTEATSDKIQIEWDPIGNDLWSTKNVTAITGEAARLVKQLSLVVIDPSSLVDDAVRDVLERIQGTYSNATSAIMVLTPFRMLGPSNTLRQIIQARAISFSTLFYQTPVPPSSPFANFGVNVGDEIDMNRLVLMSLGQYVGAQKPPNSFINP